MTAEIAAKLDGQARRAEMEAAQWYHSCAHVFLSYEVVPHPHHTFVDLVADLCLQSDAVPDSRLQDCGVVRRQAPGRRNLS